MSDNEMTQYEIAQAQYATSWEQLMPVMEKINSSEDGYTTISVDRTCVFLHRRDKDLIMYKIEDHGGLLQTIYAAVLEYVKGFV